VKKIAPVFAAFFCVLSALTALAAGGQSVHEPTTFLGDWLPRLVNFAGLLVIVYYLDKFLGIREFFKNRAIEIAKAMQESHEARERAMIDLAEMERKIKDFDVEINKMIADAQARGEKDKNALQEEGKKMVQDIQNQVKQGIEMEVRKAKSALATEASLLSLNLAEDRIKKNISDKDRQRIIKEYISNVGGKG
jgi:F-type H+-transporting ATPase subunit b